jgi:DNA-directed RNA polymerase specialized sigma24 family protein
MHNPNSYVETDERLGTPGKQGTTQAWEQLLSSRLPSFYRQAYRILGNAADAEDAVQDALLAAYTHLDQFKGQSQISTWLMSILVNCARLQLRRRPVTPMSLWTSQSEKVRHFHCPNNYQISGLIPKMSVDIPS